MAIPMPQRIVELIPMDEKPKLLLIDDDKRFLNTQRDFFQERGAILHTADRFSEATRLLKANKDFYDYIFVDYKFENEKINGAQYIDNNINSMGNAQIAMVTSVIYQRLISAELIEKYKITILDKGSGWAQKLSKIIEGIKDIKFKEFTDEIKKSLSGDVIVRVNQKLEETALHRQLKGLFLSALHDIADQRRDSLIFGGKIWTPESLYEEVEKPDSKIGKMILEVFVNYLDYTMEKKRENKK
jgi:CheY-like chemotaxis protein